MPKNPEKAKAEKIFSLLSGQYPVQKPPLDFTTPFELLIATILSAQCTDERVNKVTKTLFKKYKSPEDYLWAEDSELEQDIFSTGFYKQKTRSIKNCCAALIENYYGKVPADFDKLNSLPGVGRKTASVVAGNAFGIPAVAVDTHVKRLSNLLGFIDSDDPEKIEFRLKELIPEKSWTALTYVLIFHGRKICNAKKPLCSECIIGEYCPSYNYKQKETKRK